MRIPKTVAGTRDATTLRRRGRRFNLVSSNISCDDNITTRCSLEISMPIRGSRKQGERRQSFGNAVHFSQGMSTMDGSPTIVISEPTSEPCYFRMPQGRTLVVVTVVLNRDFFMRELLITFLPHACSSAEKFMIPSVDLIRSTDADTTKIRTYSLNSMPLNER